MIDFISFAPLGFIILLVSLVADFLFLNWWEAKNLKKFNEEKDKHVV